MKPACTLISAIQNGISAALNEKGVRPVSAVIEEHVVTLLVQRFSASQEIAPEAAAQFINSLRSSSPNRETQEEVPS
jgi:hypothetical protein